ncbi:contractile injection system tape measure protein [Cellulomonas sp. URHE0023]|uniref:contractile injection system tape measure protein n=1 Tax=Cellulomonas sp. URHE0023 TaxID=1380354 RepID=UPI000489901D|nr:contractile injection system tape measure protein [Cellulomonas sp. URHE0023]
MARQGTVTIRRQVLEVSLQGSESAGHALHRRLSSVCAGALPKAIESALASIDPGNDYLRLDSISIDVALTTVDDLETDLAEAVRREIEKHVHLYPVSSVGESGSVPDADVVEQQTPTQMADHALVTFLRTGRLPWALHLPEGTTLEQLVLDVWRDVGGHREPSPAARQGLVAALAATPWASERLTLQFTPAFVLIVLGSLSPELVAGVQEVEAVLPEARSAQTVRRAFHRTVRVVALQAAAASRVLSPGALARQAWVALAPAQRADRDLAAAVERLWPATATDDVVPAPTGPRDRAFAETAAQPATQPATQADRGEDPGLLVDSAGLVLLHPFLPRFFETLGVAVGDDVVTPDRGLCLLHHLATGEVVAPEHRLTLAKALCGLPLEMPSAADVGLTDDETAESVALLEAAIGHWDALRGTSPDALRLEFLQRPGVLSVTGDGDWLLRVDARTVDILLDQLPWGCSYVRLPWMGRPMIVEWR